MKKRLFTLVSLATVVSINALSTNALAKEATPLFKLNGKEYQLNDLSPRLQQAFHSIELKAKEGKERVLEQAMLDAHFAALAAKDNKTVEEIQKELLKVDPIEETDIQAFYEQYKDRIGAPLKDVEQRIRQTLEEQKQVQQMQSLVDELKSKGKFASLLPVPKAPVFEMNLKPYPSKGKASAPIKLVEFADYRCHYCQKAKSAVDKVFKDYPDQLQVFYIDYPVIDRGVPGISTEVAQGAYCAGKQGKYWAFHDKGYEIAASLTNDSPESIAKELNLNQSKFNACIASKEADTYMKDSIALAQKLGITGTPTFFINGQRQNFRNLEQDLRQEIERRLNGKNAVKGG